MRKIAASRNYRIYRLAQANQVMLDAAKANLKTEVENFANTLHTISGEDDDRFVQFIKWIQNNVQGALGQAIIKALASSDNDLEKFASQPAMVGWMAKITAKQSALTVIGGSILRAVNEIVEQTNPEALNGGPTNPDFITLASSIIYEAIDQSQAIPAEAKGGVKAILGAFLG